MKKLIYLPVILISLFIQQTVYAQQDFVLYNMAAVPQRMYDNPSFSPTDNVVFIAIPLVGLAIF